MCVCNSALAINIYWYITFTGLSYQLCKDYSTRLGCTGSAVDKTVGPVDYEAPWLHCNQSLIMRLLDQRKRRSFASLVFDQWIPRTKGQFCGKCFHLMTSSCYRRFQSPFDADQINIKAFFHLMTSSWDAQSRNVPYMCCYIPNWEANKGIGQTYWTISFRSTLQCCIAKQYRAVIVPVFAITLALHELVTFCKRRHRNHVYCTAVCTSTSSKQPTVSVWLKPQVRRIDSLDCKKTHTRYHATHQNFPKTFAE